MVTAPVVGLQGGQPVILVEAPGQVQAVAVELGGGPPDMVKDDSDPVHGPKYRATADLEVNPGSHFRQVDDKIPYLLRMFPPSRIWQRNRSVKIAM